MPDDTRDRVIRLEAQLEHMANQLDQMIEKVGSMHDLLQQARGAKWIIVGSAAIGGALAGKLSGLAAIFSSK